MESAYLASLKYNNWRRRTLGRPWVAKSWRMVSAWSNLPPSARG